MVRSPPKGGRLEPRGPTVASPFETLAFGELLRVRGTDIP